MRRMEKWTVQHEECHMWLWIWDRGLSKCQVCMRIIFDIWMSAAVQVEAFFSLIRPCALCHSDHSETWYFCMLCAVLLLVYHRGFYHPASLKPVISLWYLWICCQRAASCLFPLMANLASNDVMQWHNDALHSQHLFAHCSLSCVESTRGCAWQIFAVRINVSIKLCLHPCGHTVPQSAHNRPEAHLLPPTCLLLLHVIAAVSYIFV